jgi:adenylate cyclase
LNMDSMLQRLKERKLVQWGLAYLAGAWILLQVLGELRDTYAWPPVILRVVTALAGVGFFAALVIAYYHGEKGEQRVGGTELALLAAILAVAGGVVWAVGRSQAAGSTPAANSVNSAAALPARSIAVLPFENLSSDPENEYFSDGITEEILSGLAKVEGLKVAARTSSFAFKHKNVPVGEIGDLLGVAHVLEGSVRKAGNRIRISAQLVNTRTGYHLWSESYDRELKDVFAIQDEISRAIIGTLTTRLAVGGRPPLWPAVRQRTSRRTSSISRDATSGAGEARRDWSRRSSSTTRRLRAIRITGAHTRGSPIPTPFSSPTAICPRTRDIRRRKERRSRRCDSTGR